MRSASGDMTGCYVIIITSAVGLILTFDLSKSCIDPGPHNLLDVVISDQHKRLPPGVSLVYDTVGQVHAYRLTSRIASLSFPSDVFFKQCGFFPQEYSIFVTLRYESEPAPWIEQCILSISSEQTKNNDGSKINKNSRTDGWIKDTSRLLSLSIQRSKLLFRYNNTYNWFSTFNLFDGQWHNIVVSVTGETIVVTLDCRMVQRKKLQRPFPAKLDVSKSDIFVGCCGPYYGTVTARLKNVILLPEADAAARACGIYQSFNERYTLASRIRVNFSGKRDIWDGTTPKPNQCHWTDVGYLTYDLQMGSAKICVNGVWKPLNQAIDRKRHIDYVTEYQNIRLPAPAIDVEIFTIPGQGMFAAFANSGTNKKKRSKQSAKNKKVKLTSMLEKDRYVSYKKIESSRNNIGRNVASFPNIIPIKRRNTSHKRDRSAKTGNIHSDADTKDTNNGTSPYNKGHKEASNSRSVIFKWQGSKFRFYQFVTSDTAQCMKFFRIGSQYFLAVANFGFDTKAPSNSVIYKWDKKRHKFRHFQSLITWTARDFEHFTIDNNHYLAIANYATEGDSNTDSIIYKWNKSRRQMEPYQNISTIGAYDWTYLLVDGFHFLAVANAFNGVTTQLYSSIYVWQNNKFVQFQTMETNGATDFEAFTIDNVIFLAVANAYNFGPQNFRNKQSYLTNSTIYKLNRRKRQFVYFQQMPTNSAIDWEHFSIGKDHYLLLSNAQNDDAAHKTSSIYRYKGLEGFVLTHELRTLPSADWEVFKHGEDTFLVYANAKGSTSQILKVVYV